MGRPIIPSALASALEAFSESSKRKVDMLERSTKTSPSYYLVRECVKALDELEGIDGQAYAREIDKFEHEVLRVLFLEMSAHRRKDWVLNLK